MKSKHRFLLFFRSDLIQSQDDLVSYNTNPDFGCQPSNNTLKINTLAKTGNKRGSSLRLNFSKSVSLKTLNSIAKSIKSKFSPERPNPPKEFSGSVDCILTANNRNRFSGEDYEHSVTDTEEDMRSLRRVESERRGNASTPR